mgnify:CR=1 FL=1
MAYPQYSSVGGDGDWKAYYKKRQTDIKQLIERITILENGGVPETDLTEIRSSINDLKQDVKDLQNVTYPGTDYDDTEVQQAIVNLKKRCTQLENKMLEVLASTDVANIKAEMLSLRADITSLKGTKADKDSLYEEIDKLKALGYDTKELEDKIKNIIEELPEQGETTVNQQLISIAQQWENKTGPFAEIFSRLDALEHGNSGQPCQNKNEIAAIKQRLEAAGI